MTTSDVRAVEEAEALRWARRRRLREDSATVVFAVGYAVVLGRDADLIGLAVAFPFLAVAVRTAAWRWRDRAVEAQEARVGWSLRQHRLVGWARLEQVDEEARDRVGRTVWRRIGMGLLLAGAVVLTVLTAQWEPPGPLYAVLGSALLVWAAADLARQERELREARRWLADPPS